MARRVRILSGNSELNSSGTEPGGCDAAICLFWAVASTKERLAASHGGRCYDLSDLSRSDSRGDEETYRLTNAIVEAGPKYGSLFCRSYLAEPLFRELRALRLLQTVIQLVSHLKKEWASQTVEVEAEVDTRTLEALLAVALEHTGIVVGPTGSQESGSNATKATLVSNVRQRIREARLTGRWSKHVADAAESIDKNFYVRRFLGALMPARVPSPGEICFLLFLWQQHADTDLL